MPSLTEQAKGLEPLTIKNVGLFEYINCEDVGERARRYVAFTNAALAAAADVETVARLFIKAVTVSGLTTQELQDGIKAARRLLGEE